MIITSQDQESFHIKFERYYLSRSIKSHINPTESINFIKSIYFSLQLKTQFKLIINFVN